MKVKNHQGFAFTKYNQTKLDNHTYGLGDIVIADKEEDPSSKIGVIIQLHGDGDYRLDSIGNQSPSDFRLATLQEIKQYRPLLTEDERREYIDCETNRALGLYRVTADTNKEEFERE